MFSYLAKIIGIHVSKKLETKRLVFFSKELKKIRKNKIFIFFLLTFDGPVGLLVAAAAGYNRYIFYKTNI